MKHLAIIKLKIIEEKIMNIESLNEKSNVLDLYNQANRLRVSGNIDNGFESRNFRKIVMLTNSVLDSELQDTFEWKEVLAITEQLFDVFSFTVEDLIERGILEPEDGH